MPVQTRKRRKASSSSSSTHANSSSSAAAEPKAAATKTPAVKKAKTAASPTQKKQQQHETAMDVDAKEPRDQFNSVVNEIDRSGKVLKSKHLSRPSAAVKKLEDPKKAPLRKAVNEELRRMSTSLLEGDLERLFAEPADLKPNAVKAKVQAEQQRKKAGVTVVRKALVKEIDTLGENGVQEVLHPLKGDTKKSKAVARGVAKRTAKKEPKQVSKKALEELEELVTPTTVHRPSLVKSKLNVKSAKARVNTEVLKAVNIKEIDRLGPEGIKAQLKHVPGAKGATAEASPAKKAATKKSPKKK